MSLAAVLIKYLLKLEVCLILPMLMYLAYFIKEIENLSTCYVELLKHLRICKYAQEVWRSTRL